MIKIDCISDTHGFFPTLTGGDILVHAGDATNTGTNDQILKFLSWFQVQPYKHKILVPGNHDFGFEKNPGTYAGECQHRGIHLLQDSGVTLEGLKIWGSPVQPWFHDWAFNRKRGPEIRGHWEQIPKVTDLLITHGPPLGIMDRNEEGDFCGCEDLLELVKEINPKYHVFGHIHEGYGSAKIRETLFVNASIMNRRYVPVNKPIRIEHD